MSIRLPHSQKELHFTGSVKALGPERPAIPLGQERPKGPLPAPPSVPRTIQRFDPAPFAEPVRLSTMRGQLPSMDDDSPTEALDRDGLNATLFPVARRELPAGPIRPVPHFRSAAEARAHHGKPTVLVPRQRRVAGGSLPLSAWLIAALISGIVSYQLAPAVVSVAQAVRAIDSR